MKQSTYVLTIGLVLAISGCAEDKSAPQDQTGNDAGMSQSETRAGEPMIKPWGYPLDALDRNTRPQDDLYRFANGGWLDANAIPDDRSSIGFSQGMRDRNDQRIAAIIADAAKNNPADGSNEQKIRDLHASYMDIDAINAAGLAPIKPFLERIAKASTHDDIAALMADPLLGARSLFGMGVGADSKDPENYTVWASHAGLALPDKSYYERESDRLASLRTAYQAYMATVFTRIEQSDPDARAEAVFELEKAIASDHWSRAERRNADRTYNPVVTGGMNDFAPGFPWAIYMEAAGLSGTDKVVVREKSAFAPLAALFAETPVDVWRDYLSFHVVASHASLLSDEIAAERFAFFGKELRGQKSQRPREQRAVLYVNSALNQAVGKIYIDRYFSQESKRQVGEMFENIRTILGQRIENLTWMGPETKAKALEKLSKMKAKIAYPEKWTNYSAVSIGAGGLMDNVLALRQFNHDRSVARLGTKVDKREWFSGPQTVNAFYSPTRNEAFIPAGYIQSPLFDPHADPALNYGALGSIIGHEIGHGFDDQGSKYDAYGRLQSWWTEKDRAAFEKEGDKFADQFNQYQPLPGLSVNGRQTLGENIGDLAGMIVAFHAYQLSLDGQDAPILDGFTGPQRFFLGRAQGRRFKRTEASLRQRLLSAPHSPMYLRVNGMARNMDEFYQAFTVTPDDSMYISPEKRVRIW